MSYYNNDFPLTLSTDKQEERDSSSLILSLAVVAVLLTLGFMVAAVIAIVLCVKRKREKRTLPENLSQTLQRAVEREEQIKQQKSCPPSDSEMKQNIAYGLCGTEQGRRDKTFLYNNLAKNSPHVKREYQNTMMLPVMTGNIAYGLFDSQIDKTPLYEYPVRISPLAVAILCEKNGSRCNKAA